MRDVEYREEKFSPFFHAGKIMAGTEDCRFRLSRFHAGYYYLVQKVEEVEGLKPIL